MVLSRRALWRPPICLLGLLAAVSQAAEASPRPTIFVTYADDEGEGLPLTLGILRISAGSVRVLAGINGSVASAAATRLSAAGAELHSMHPLPDFDGVDSVFLLPPNTEDRVFIGRSLIDLAVAAGVPQAMLMSIMYAERAWAHPDVRAYADLEAYFNASWPASAGQGSILRTWFYQQNLLLWAADAQETGALRLPAGSSSEGCFAPLYNEDVSRVIVALASKQEASSSRGFGSPNIEVLNLAGPRALTGPQLAQVAGSAIGEPALQFILSDYATAFAILQKAAAGTGLTTSEVNMILGLLTLQTEGCTNFDDILRVTGRNATDVEVFFRENAASFHRSASAAPQELVV